MNSFTRSNGGVSANPRTAEEELITALVLVLEPFVRRVLLDTVRIAVDERLPRWLTPKQAGERIGIGSSAVRERIRNGTLRASKWNDRWYVEAAEIDRCIADARYHPRLPHNSGAARLEPSAPGHKE